MSTLLLNVIHRADGGDKLDALRFQQDEAHRCGFRTTLLLSYLGLQDPEVVAYARQQHAEHGDELGIHLHELGCADYHTRFATRETAIYLLPWDTRVAVLRYLFERFENAFGRPPVSVGSYILDGQTLAFLKQEYPSVKGAIVSCFEEGVNMYHGNNHCWTLFSDGGPWGLYWPTRRNHLVPARTSDEAVGIVGFPHLNRDMLLALTSRDDLFSSHPMNLVRAMGNDGPECTYMYRFIDQWVEQAKRNGFAYYSLFVSSPWVNWCYEEEPANLRRLYTASLEYLAALVKDSAVSYQTMAETAAWYARNVPTGSPDTCHWRDLLCGSKREMAWYVDPWFRVAIDPHLGGTIVDLRPYAGRCNGDLGPDTENRENGNYPFLMCARLRGGTWMGPLQGCTITIAGKTTAFWNHRTRGSLVRSADGTTLLRLEPMVVLVDKTEVIVESTYHFLGGGVIRIERKVLGISVPGIKVTLTEVHRGSPGTNEYPENLRGIRLIGTDASGTRTTVDVAYRTTAVKVAAPVSLTAEIPRLGISAELSPVAPSGDVEGVLEDAKLFVPNYAMQLSRDVGPGQSLTTTLKIAPL